MLLFVARRLLYLIPVLIAVSLLTFFIASLLPGDLAYTILGDQATPEKVAARIRKVIAAVPPERVTLSTDCGMKPLARMVAKMKLSALAAGAQIVRKELQGK